MPNFQTDNHQGVLFVQDDITGTPFALKGDSATGALNISAVIDAGTSLIGRVSSSNETSTIYSGTTALTPKFAAIAAASSGDNTIVAAVTSKKIRVLAINFVLSAATNCYIKDGAATIIWAGSTNTANFAANSGLILPYNPVGWFETAAGQGLVLNLSAANKAGGSLTYVEV